MTESKSIYTGPQAATLRAYVLSHYVTALQTQGCWNVTGTNARSAFWSEEKVRQAAEGDPGPVPDDADIASLLQAMPDRVGADLAMCLHSTDLALSDYIRKQDRLAGLADTVSSEIRLIDSCERSGEVGFEKYHFLLTIDDGPSVDNQKAMLANLDAEHIKAIFFLIGEHAAECGLTPEPYLKAGHDVGMHTSHADMDKDVTCLMIKPLMTRFWFRAHGGSRTTEYTSKIKEAGGFHLLWNIDSRDWEFVGFIGDKNAPTGALEERQNRALANAVVVSLLRGHGIVLFHETVQASPDTVARYVRIMKALGCEFVTPESVWARFKSE